MANLLIEPFYSSEKIEDLGMLKGGTLRCEKLRRILENWNKFFITEAYKQKGHTLFRSIGDRCEQYGAYKFLRLLDLAKIYLRRRSLDRDSPSEKEEPIVTWSIFRRKVCSGYGLINSLFCFNYDPRRGHGLNYDPQRWHS